jgi:hypothetical protein
MDQLQDVIAFNSLCYAEAYSYCVFEAFPKKGNSEFATEQSGLDGATACSLSLGLSAGTSKIIAPVMSGVWSLAKGHWLVSTIFLVLVVIAVFFAFWPRR